MSRERAYTLHQYKLIQAAAKTQIRKLGNQTKVGLAMGVSQQSVGNLLDGKYWPAPDKAEHLATLEGFGSLEEMIGPYRKDDAPASSRTTKKKAGSNLDVCISFYAGAKSWSPWTLAAARAGYFHDDVPAPAWVERLDKLEATLAATPIAVRRK